MSDLDKNSDFSLFRLGIVVMAALFFIVSYMTEVKKNAHFYTNKINTLFFDWKLLLILFPGVCGGHGLVQEDEQKDCTQKSAEKQI